MISASRRILIADEDLEMRDLIGSQITVEYGDDLVIDQAANGKEVLRNLLEQKLEQKYDLAIVNWTLPEISKSELLVEMRKLRSAFELPILVLVSSSDPDFISSVLEAGASELLGKPFERVHLLGKVKMFLKKEQPQSSDQIIWGELILDTRTFDVYCKGERVQLTPSEFKLLQALVEHRGAILTREKLIERVQGEGVTVVDRAVNTHIFSLRKKLGALSDVVQTVRGSGYRIK